MSVESRWLPGHCYCGEIAFEVNADPAITPFRSLYCHCESCRRAHSAPLYQVIYIDPTAFRITKGEDEHLKSFIRPKEGSPQRFFCGNCGSRIKNHLPAQPDLGIGFFPALLEETIQHNLPDHWRPNRHHLCIESVLPIDKICDGLERR